MGNDPLASEYNDIDDVPESIKSGVREWFRWYKTPDDKPLNGFGFDEAFLNKAEAEKIIGETHEAWKKLKSGETEAGKLWISKDYFFSLIKEFLQCFRAKKNDELIHIAI